MERREFGYVAALAVLPGCSETVSDDTAGGDQSDDDATNSASSDVPGLDSDGVEDLDAFLDAQRDSLESTAHTFSLTETAAETFEDGFKAGEMRAKYDPSAQRLRTRRWWRYPDGDRSGETDIYANAETGAERTESSDGDVRLEAISPAAARERYAAFRESVRELLAALTYGSLEDRSEADGARYRLPITGVRDGEGERGVQGVGSGQLSITEAGLIATVEIRELVEMYSSERRSDLSAAVSAAGETTVAEPDWFADVPEQTSDGGGGGTGGAGGDGGDDSQGTTVTSATTTTEPTTERTTERTTISGDHETVVVAPGGDLVFDPETLRIPPGTTVLWVWDSDNHNVKPDDQPAEADWRGVTDLSDEGTTYEYTFEVEGRYEYVCEPHFAVGMEGEIIVESQ